MQMKKVLSILLVAVMLFSAIPFTAFATDSGVWQECSSGDIANGDTVIVTMTNASDATFGLYNSNGSASAPTAVALEISSDGKLTGSDSDLADCTWTVGRDGDTFTFSHGGDSLICNNTNNGVRLGYGNNTFEIDNGYLKNSGTGRYVGVYNGQDWRCYTKINDNIKNQTLKFWKYVQGTTEPEPATTTVTWTSSQMENINIITEYGENTVEGNSIGGITVDPVGSVMWTMDYFDFEDGSFIFTSSGDDISSIVITAGYVDVEELSSGWTVNSTTLIWSGTPAKSVTLSATGGFVSGISQVVFTLGNGASAHTHSFSYSAVGALLTATCTADDCDLTSNPTLEIVAPALTTYGGTGSADATLTGMEDFNADTGKAVAQTDVKYVGRDGTEYEESATAPTTEGKYTAKITVEEQTASVDYEIANPDYTITTPADLVGGSVVADKQSAKFGEEVTLTVTPADNNHILRSLIVKDSNDNDVTVTDNKFTMPVSNVTVSATFEEKSQSGVELTLTGDGGTASLLNTSYAELTSEDKITEGEKFVVRVNKDDKHEFDVSLSAGNDENIQEFTSADYEAYLAFAEENGIFVSSDTALFWVTMPCIENQDLTVTVTFVEIKTYTILYQHAADTNPDAVFCKVSRTVQGQNDIKYTMMKGGATIGDTAVWSLTITSTQDPSQVSFVAANKPFANDLSTTLENAAMSTATVSQTSDSWTNIAGGKYLIVGGNAKLVAAAFVSDASSMAVYGNNSFAEAASTAGVKYQFAVCPTDNEGNVTAASTVKAPAASTKEGFDFAGWRGFEGTAPYRTERIYQVGESISITDNTILNAVWNRKNPTVDFNLNGGTGSIGNTTVAYGEKLTIAANPTKSGFAFDGWTVSESVTENGVFFAKGSAFDLNTPITANLKLAAKWKHVHSYTGFRVTRFASLSKYHKYDSAVHVAVCGCGDVQLLAHEFNSNGKCSCGYQKAVPTTATLYVSYGQWSNGTYTEKMQGVPETVKKGEEVSISAPGYWGSLQFSKWQYSAGDGKWLDLTADAYASFILPCTLYVRALYINPITAPQIELSARHYDDQAVVNDKTYTMGNILFQMNYKLPDGCTFVDGGIKMGDNSGISYYFIQEVRVAYDNECKGIIAGLGVGMGALSGLVSGGGALTTFIDVASTMNDTGVYYNYLETEDNVLEKEMDAATLAQYMYEGKPVNIEKYDPIYWGADVQTKGMSGSVATIPPLRFAQKNNQNHYIYGIGWMRYKDSAGNIKTIYTDALPATVNNVPANPVIKTGESSLKAVANLASGKKLAGLNRGLVTLGNTSTGENTNVDVIFSTDIQLNTYVDGTWNADLSGGYGFGDTATVTAPDIAGKSFSHWEADGSIISYSKTLKLTMNAHTALYAVYADTAPTAQAVAGFTSITRTSDGKISFQAIASGANAGIVYSTTASGNELVIGGSGVTNVAAASLTDETTAMPASVMDGNSCWMLKITPDSADTVYHARAYVTVGGETIYGDIKDIQLSDLDNGISLVANLGGFDSENSLSDTLDEVTVAMHTITWKNGDGSVIGTTVVEDGTVPTFTGTAPADYSDTYYNYTFAGWTPAPVAATEDATYTAVYSQSVRQYTVTWKNYDDSVIGTSTVNAGQTPEFSDSIGQIKAKPADGNHSYEFTGWTPEIVAAEADAEYTATFVDVLSISNVDEWNSFAASVKDGNTYSGKIVRMTADVGPVTTMVAGTFSGTFDGGSHTLTVNISGGNASVATFQVVKDATIQNLTLAGSITSSGIHSAALVKSVSDSGTSCTIKNVDIYADVNCAQDYIGGFIGHAGVSNTILIENSAYLGAINKTGNAQGNFIGGFVGWCQKATVTINNCAFTGSYSNIKSFNNIGFSYNASPNVTVNDFYSNATEVFVANVNHGTRLYVPNSGYTTVVALVNHGGEKTFFNQLSDALNAWVDGSTLMLMSDVTTASTISVGGNKTLDLNGYKLTISSNSQVISVQEGGDLTIKSSAQGGEVIGCNADRAVVGGKGQTLTLESGTIKTAASNGISGTNAVLNLNGGAIECTSNSSDMTVASAVYCKGNCTVNWNGTSITTNTGCGFYSKTTTDTVKIGGGSFAATADTLPDNAGYVLSNFNVEIQGAPVLNGKGIHLSNGRVINVTGELTNDVPIGVVMQTPGVFTSGLQGNGGIANFANGNGDDYGIGLDASGEAQVVRKYTITWKNGDEVLDTTEVLEGTVPTFTGTAPADYSDTYYNYTFAGWTPAPVAATADATYTAAFTATAKTFTVFVKTLTGKTIFVHDVTGETTAAQIKDMLVQETGLPAAQQKLIFAGTEMDDAKTLADFNIQKESTIHCVPVNYTVTWLNYDGSELASEPVGYGVTPEYTGATPQKPDDATNYYTFAGWTPEVTAVTGEATYTATFTATEKPAVIKDCNNKFRDFRLYANVPFLAGWDNLNDMLTGAIGIPTYSDSNTYFPLMDTKGYSYKLYDQTGTEIPFEITDSDSEPGSGYGLAGDVTVYTKVLEFTRPAGCNALYIVASEPAPAPQNNVNLTLGDDITTNYYVDYNAYEGAGAAKIVYTYNSVNEREENVPVEETVDLNDIPAGLLDGDKLMLTVSQAPAQMAEPVEIEILNANNQVIATLDYSAKSYCDKVLGMSDEALAEYTTKGEELRTLCHTLLAYGEAAQGVFADYETTAVTCESEAVNAQIANATATATHSVDNSGMIKFSSVSFVCTKDARLRFYLDTSGATSTPAAPTATLGNASLKYTMNDNVKKYFVEVSEIKAQDFGKKITVNYGGSTINFSVLDFAGIVLRNGSGASAALQHFAKTLVVYNTNALAFFSN